MDWLEVWWLRKQLMSFWGLTLGDVPSTVHKGFSHTTAEELFGRTGERGSGLWIERRVVLQSSPYSQYTHYFGGNVDCWPPVKSVWQRKLIHHMWGVPGAIVTSKCLWDSMLIKNGTEILALTCVRMLHDVVLSEQSRPLPFVMDILDLVSRVEVLVWAMHSWSILGTVPPSCSLHWPPHWHPHPHLASHNTLMPLVNVFKCFSSQRWW